MFVNLSGLLGFSGPLRNIQKSYEYQIEPTKVLVDIDLFCILGRIIVKFRISLRIVTI